MYKKYGMYSMQFENIETVYVSFYKSIDWVLQTFFFLL